MDGEYEIAVTPRSGAGPTSVLGMERERKLDLRLDDQRLELFTIAAVTRDRPGPGFGSGTDPDAHLKVRVPVKAGARTIIATFLKDTVVPEDILFRPRSTPSRRYFEGVGTVSVAGPFNAQGPGATPSRDKIFVCHPAARAEEEACAEKIIAISRTAPTGARSKPDDLPQLIALYQQGAATGGFEAGVRLALQKILVSPEFIFRMELDPLRTRRREAFTGSATSSWRRGCPSSCGAAFPTTSCSRLQSAGSSAIRRYSRARCGECWPIRARRHW